jgi:CIC family chloride channel protein
MPVRRRAISSYRGSGASDRIIIFWASMESSAWTVRTSWKAESCEQTRRMVSWIIFIRSGLLNCADLLWDRRGRRTQAVGCSFVCWLGLRSSTMRDRLRASGRALGRPGATAAFLALAVVVGVVVGLAAAALIGAISGVSRLAEWVGQETGLPKVVALAAVPVGLLLAWALSRRFPEVAADGVPEAAAAVAIRSGYLPTRGAPLKIVATALTVGLGGSVGREGPIVQIGATVGSSIARHTGLGEDRVRSLVAAGAGAAIGASFNAPIAGMFFAIEVILGNFAIRHLNAVVVASVAAAVTTRSIVGEELILRAPGRLGLGDARELLLYALVGLAAVGVAWVFLRLLDGVHTLRHRGPGWLRPVLLGLAVGGIGWVEPDILGTGQNVVRGLVSTLSSGDVVWWSVLALVGYKVVATSLTLGVGGFGGVFMPSLFIGAALGAGFADLIAPVWGFSDLQPGAFAIVGMAATFSAVARAPLTSILIVFEITGDYNLVLPLMLAASLATLIGDRVHRDSVYAMALARQGIRLRPRGEIDLLDTVRVSEVASPVGPLASPGLTTAQVQGVLDRYRRRNLLVVDDGRLVGVITGSDIMRTGGPSDQVTAGEAMTPRPVTVTPASPVSEAMERMASLGVGVLPVVAVDDSYRLVGVFRREEAVAAYHRALGREVHHQMGRERLRARTGPGAAFHDLEVPGGSVADGRAVRHLPVPDDCTIVAVRRGAAVSVPHGDTVLRGGDVITVFGSETAYRALAERLHLDEWTTGEQPRVPPEPTARFFEVEIPAGSVADGRVIREVPVPGGCTIVSVRRGSAMLVPDGGTLLAAGDVLTLFAHPAAREQFAERLLAGRDG